MAVALRLGWADGLLASAELGLPAGVVSLGLAEGLLRPGQGAAVVAAALITLAASAVGAALLSRTAAVEPPRRAVAATRN